MPSEFKAAWDELATELIIDAFTNIDQYQEVVPLVQELFIAIDEEIHTIKSSITLEVGSILHLEGEKAIGLLETRLQPLFQEYSLQVFSFSDS